jgi:hypothetical protein
MHRRSGEVSRSAVDLLRAQHARLSTSARRGLASAASAAQPSRSALYSELQLRVSRSQDSPAMIIGLVVASGAPMRR